MKVAEHVFRLPMSLIMFASERSFSSALAPEVPSDLAETLDGVERC
jgi:hypothetical protein